MGRRKGVYEEIAHFYGIQFLSDSDKSSFRQQIRRKLKETFPEYPWSNVDDWNNLTDTERCKFKCYIIRSYCSSRPKTIDENELNKRISTETETVFLKQEKAIKDYNQRVDNIFFRNFYDKNLSDLENKELFDEFCKILQEYDKNITKPTYGQEWFNGPHTVDGYCRKELSDPFISMIHQAESAEEDQSKVDHYALRALIKYLEAKLAIKVDFDGIKSSLECRQICSQWDPSEEIDGNSKHIGDLLIGKEKLETLDFIIENK